MSVFPRSDPFRIKVQSVRGFNCQDSLPMQVPHELGIARKSKHCSRSGALKPAAFDSRSGARPAGRLES